MGKAKVGGGGKRRWHKGKSDAEGQQGEVRDRAEGRERKAVSKGRAMKAV